MKVSFCDGGLCNRLNSLIFCLILKEKYGHEWEVSWPRNNWCGAGFEKLFELDLPVHDRPLLDYKQFEEQYRFLLHENPCGFKGESVTPNASLPGFEEYRSLLDTHRDVLYTHNLIPGFVTLPDIALGFKGLRINADLRRTAEDFCRERGVDSSVYGLHIRKTDFGNTVNDEELFRMVSASDKRFFVCSDDEEVNRRFGGLANCAVFEKKYFPQKRVESAGWEHWITDSEGRSFPFNIERSEEAVLEALVDLLILSRTTPVKASNSTFFTMATIFRSTGFF